MVACTEPSTRLEPPGKEHFISITLTRISLLEVSLDLLGKESSFVHSIMSISSGNFLISISALAEPSLIITNTAVQNNELM